MDKILLKEELLNIYSNGIDILSNENQDNLILSLPIFLATGDIVSIYINKSNNTYEFSNLMYKEIMICLNKPKLLSQHLLDKNKHSEAKSNILIKNNINIDEFLTKKVEVSNIRDLCQEIFIYSHYITTYYNYIYNYMVTYMKSPHKKNIFQQSVKRFIDNYNEQNRERQIKPMNNEFISNSSYYLTNKKSIITTTNNKYNLTETIIDFQNLNENKSHYKEAYILLKANEISKDYLSKLEKTRKKLNLKFIEISDITNIESDEYNTFKEEFLK